MLLLHICTTANGAFLGGGGGGGRKKKKKQNQKTHFPGILLENAAEAERKVRQDNRRALNFQFSSWQVKKVALISRGILAENWFLPGNVARVQQGWKTRMVLFCPPKPLFHSADLMCLFNRKDL